MRPIQKVRLVFFIVDEPENKRLAEPMREVFPYPTEWYSPAKYITPENSFSEFVGVFI